MIDQFATKNEIECIMFQYFDYKTFEDFEVNIDGNTFTFQSNPEIDKNILKNNGFFTYELPAPLPKENTWLKQDRKSTRLNSSHVANSYAVFCLKKKMIHTT